MEKFMYLFIIGCMLNAAHLCHDSPEKRKRSFEWPIYNSKQAKYEIEHYQAYSTNIDLYTNWPELKISGRLKENTCKMYLKNLFTNIDYKQCVVTPSIRPIRFFYMANISRSFGHLIGEPLILNSLLCHVHQKPASIHRKYFHLIRAPLPECVYLTNRRQRGPLDFRISLRLCKCDTYQQLKKSELLGAVNKQKWLPRKERRDCDSIKKQEEYERSHQLWINENSVKADTWPELAGENLGIFCGKLLMELYPKTTITFENIDPMYYFKNLNYTKLRNTDGSELPSLQVIMVSCETRKKNGRGGHIFIRAPNHGSLNCVYMIRTAKNRTNKHLQIIKRLCIQHLYVHEKQEGAVTNTGVNGQVNNENVSGPIIIEGYCKDSIKPTPTKEEGLYN